MTPLIKDSIPDEYLQEMDGIQEFLKNGCEKFVKPPTLKLRLYKFSI